MYHPDPPAAATLKPAIEMWPAGRRLTRAYDARFGLLAFNATATAGRFRPVTTPEGVIVPTAYAAEDDETAIAERLLRGVDPEHQDRPRRLLRRAVRGVELAEVAATRDLKLVRLHGLGLQRLRLARAELIESGRDRYAWTATWAQALHDCPGQPDGLIWTARQNDSAKAVILFATRGADRALRLDGRATPLDRGEGYERLLDVCLTAGVDLEPWA